MKTVLTIAGSDCSGGAGIQADLKTMTAWGIYGMSVVTAVTVQNTLGVKQVALMEPEVVAEQIDAIFQDIRPDAVKIGMLGNDKIADAVARRLAHYKARHVVLDPVLASTSKRHFLDEEGVQVMKAGLFPLAELVTPNIPEVMVLQSGYRTAEEAAESLSKQYHLSILLKGGHRKCRADDLLCTEEEKIWFPGERILTDNTHGTGCTLSSAIACGLAMGFEMRQAVKEAKAYLTEAIRREPGLGNGKGPLNHCIPWQKGRSTCLRDGAQ